MAPDPNNPKTAALAGTMARIQFKPKAPTMGGLAKIGSNEWAPWVGGKPKADRRELQDKNPTFLDPCQHRPVSVGSAQKSKKCCVEAIEEMLTKGGNLLDFQKLI